MNQPKISIKLGGGIGTMLAVALSWGLRGSILWAVLHGICGWLYVIYYVITQQ